MILLTVLILNFNFASVYGLDLVRSETMVDEAKSKYGVTGKGVTIAILDRGIDWRNPDFINPDGTTRIKYLLDMTGQNLCNTYNPAALEYTESEINSALAGGTPINSHDFIGHGTATAGVAAGNGRAFAGGKYHGIAPEADLIIVKMTSEGALAHDSQAAETSFQGCIDDALNWLDKKIDLLGQPVVVLINSGTQWGPIDGTSSVSQKIDKMFGLNKLGRVYVAPSGDEGSLDNHAGGHYDETADTTVHMTKAINQSIYMQMWYSGTNPAKVTITFADGTTVGPVGPGESVNKNGIFLIQYEPGQEFYPWQSTDGDRAIWINIFGHAGDGTINIRGTTSNTGKFDIYGDESGPNLSPIITFKDHLVDGRLNDYASTRSAIVVGDYVMRTSYTDIDGVSRVISDEGSTGDLWTKSSGGPTRDGRTPGVDISAPGQNIFTSLSQNSYWSTLRGNLIQDGGGWYVRFGGTSASAPIVVGAVALMLQLNPKLTGQEVKNILHKTATSDQFTGNTPNENWGFGKLNLLGALDEVSKTVQSIQPFNDQSPSTPTVVCPQGTYYDAIHDLCVSNISRDTVPEFPFAIPILLISITSLIVFFKIRIRK